MEKILKETEEKMQQVIDRMSERFLHIRAGRANASILDGVMVSYYGVPTPINQIAQINIPEARQIAIKPFDKNSLGEIEKAIYDANIGLTPNNNGDFIIINIPALTEETRRDYVKQVKSIAEEARIALRTIRQEANNLVKKEDLTEDDEKYSINQIQELINKFNQMVENKTKEKEEELLKV